MKEITLGLNGTHSVIYFTENQDPRPYGDLDYLHSLYLNNWMKFNHENIENFAGSPQILPPAKISFINRVSGENGISFEIEEGNGMKNLIGFLQEYLREKGFELIV